MRAAFYVAAVTMTFANGRAAIRTWFEFLLRPRLGIHPGLRIPSNCARPVSRGLLTPAAPMTPPLDAHGRFFPRGNDHSALAVMTMLEGPRFSLHLLRRQAAAAPLTPNKEEHEKFLGVATCLDFLPPGPCRAAALPFMANATFAC